MRDFNDADRKKKSLRIELSDNPGNLSKEAIHRLEEAVKASMKDGYIPCPLGWKIASDIGVDRKSVV